MNPPPSVEVPKRTAIDCACPEAGANDTAEAEKSSVRRRIIRPALRAMTQGASMRPSRTHAWPIHRHAAGALHQPALERQVLDRIVGPRPGPHADPAVAQPALERAQRLPFQAIDRIAGRMA